MCFSQPNSLSGARLAERSRHQKSVGQGMEVEATIKAIGKCSEANSRHPWPGQDPVGSSVAPGQKPSPMTPRSVAAIEL